MSKHLIKGFVYHVQYDFDGDNFRLKFHESESMGKSSPDWALVCPYEFWVEVPDDFDPRPSKIVALRDQKREVQAKFAAMVNEIDKRIGQLLAIEN
jgi:hypothetical protein